MASATRERRVVAPRAGLPAVPADRPDLCLDATLDPGDGAGVGLVRHRIMAELADRARPGADLDAAEIVVGELLGNAVAHTAGPAWVTLRWDGTHPLLSVADLGPGFGPEGTTIEIALPDDPLADGGRGLFLACRLAVDVAVAARAGGGSVVSATLDLLRRAECGTDAPGPPHPQP